MDTILKKTFKKHPDAFWLDMLLHCYEYSITGNVAFNEKSINNEFNHICQKQKGELYFEPTTIPIYLAKLLSDGNIEIKGDGFKITHKGLSFIMLDGGYIKQAQKSEREDKRFNFEYYKIGYDSVVSMLALILSIIALIYSLK